jgi:hypothetical protein
VTRRELTPEEEARNRRIAFALAVLIVGAAAVVFLALVAYVVVVLVGAIS